MNIDSVKKLIASLEAAGELTIKERIYLYSMKEHMALAEENSLMRKLLPDYISVPATDNFLASLRAEGVEMLRDSLSEIEIGVEDTIDLRHYCSDFARQLRESKGANHA